MVGRRGEFIFCFTLLIATFVYRVDQISIKSGQNLYEATEPILENLIYQTFKFDKKCIVHFL